MAHRTLAGLLLVLLGLALVGCNTESSPSVPGSQTPGVTLHILSGSEHKTHQPNFDRSVAGQANVPKSIGNVIGLPGTKAMKRILNSLEQG